MQPRSILKRRQDDSPPTMTFGRNRFVSLPNMPVPQSSIERDRAAKASGHAPSLVLPGDSTDNRLHQSPPRQNFSPRPLPPRAQKPHPHLVIRNIEPFVRKGRFRLADQLDIEDILAAHEQELVCLQQAAAERDNIILGKPPENSTKRVFGLPLREVVGYAYASTVIGTYSHDLPAVVYACVEELQRTGIYQHGLFRALPNRSRHLQLIGAFDVPVSYDPVANLAAPLPSLRAESMPDICALLVSYLSALPTPPVDLGVYSGLWSWCVKPCLCREDEHREREEWDEEDRRDRLNSRPPSKKRHSRSPPTRRPPASPSSATLQAQAREEALADAQQTILATHLLLLLPISHLALFSYLLSFFTQIPLSPENGITYDDLARIFSLRLLAGRRENEVRKVMVWLLTHWARISEGLWGAGGIEGGVTDRKGSEDSDALSSPTCASDSEHRSEADDVRRSSFSSADTSIEAVEDGDKPEFLAPSERLFRNRADDKDTYEPSIADSASVYSSATIVPSRDYEEERLHSPVARHPHIHHPHGRANEGASKNAEMQLGEARLQIAQLECELELGRPNTGGSAAGLREQEDTAALRQELEHVRHELQIVQGERDKARRLVESIRDLIEEGGEDL